MHAVNNPSPRQVRGEIQCHSKKFAGDPFFGYYKYCMCKENFGQEGDGGPVSRSPPSPRSGDGDGYGDGDGDGDDLVQVKFGRVGGEPSTLLQMATTEYGAYLSQMQVASSASASASQLQSSL